MAAINKNWLKSAWQTPAFFGAFVLFAVTGSLASILCIGPAIFFRGARARRCGQKLIHGLFRFFMGYVRACGLVEFDVRGAAGLCQQRGQILVANHPCLMDAVLVVSQVSQAVCLMKGSLARNLIFSGTSRLAGYINNKSGLGLVKQCEERLREGASLLVFPEGTRTVGGTVLPFKMGFALVAVLTQAPVQTLIITSESGHLGKGQPLLKIPVFPMRYSLRLGRRFQPEPGEDAKTFGGAVENYFQEALLPPVKNQTAALSNK